MESRQETVLRAVAILLYEVPVPGPSLPPPQTAQTSPRAGLPAGGTAAGAGAKAARIVLVGVWLGVALVHLSLAAERRIQVWPLGYLLLEILACSSLTYRAWRTRGGARLAWWLLAVSAFLEVPNLILQAFLGVQGWVSAWSQEVTSLLSLATGILVLAGVLSFPKDAGQGGRMSRRRIMDGLIFAVSLLFLLLVMGVQGSLRSAAQGIGFRVFVAYLNAALLGGGIVFMTAYHPERIRGPLGWLGASALAWLAALSCWALAGLPAVLATRSWVIVAGGIPLFQGLAAWSFRPPEAAEAPDDSSHKLARLLPYLPVVAALVALAMLLPRASLHELRGVLGIFLAMVALLLLRQFQAILDLQAARSTLEARVRHRTEALERAQDTLLRTERMNTVALMGAGLAHDLNNLLCAMKSSAELAAMNLEAGLPVNPEELSRIASTADRAAHLTRRLMGFVRRDVEQLSPMDLGGVVKEMEAILRLLLPRSVELRIQVLAGKALIVESSRLRLEQMLVNLVANARDAMPDGGRLTIQAGLGVPETDHAMIEVVDTGVGMAPETLERIFEPFFTTKPPGKGTGLGLSSLKAMVEEGGGRLAVESELGKGSRFRILLPRLSN